MIDCENEVYTMIATALRAAFPGIDLASEYVNSPAAFPHVSVVMSDCYTLTECSDSGPGETAVATFTINIFSNKTGAKKSQCKAIVKNIDSLLSSNNFTRFSLTPVPNTENASIYRIVAQYRVATDGKYFFRL